MKTKPCVSRLLLVCLAAMPCSLFAETLTVTVTGLKAGKGNLRVAVFDEAHRGGFPEGDYAHSATVPAAEEQVTVEIADIEPGRYAIAVIQDLNENKKLDRNFLKIPKEPYGFSGSWKSGSASYEEAAIDIEAGGSAITIKLK
jgi:uncharacterized protein (DUF2141 family)